MREWVCLLRAVNLGARNKVAMPRLRAALTEAGFADVRTYLQSGNIVLRTDIGDAGEIAEAVRRIVEKHFGIDTPVLTRTPRQIRDVLAWCPYPAEAAARPVTVHVVFLDTEPAPDRVAALLAGPWSPDRIEVRGREACIAYATSMHASRLQHAVVLKRLATGGTARNWRTVAAIADLLS
jgi:uncharacterized protein (DUF1697 family)